MKTCKRKSGPGSPRGSDGVHPGLDIHALEDRVVVDAEWTGSPDYRTGSPRGGGGTPTSTSNNSTISGPIENPRLPVNSHGSRASKNQHHFLAQKSWDLAIGGAATFWPRHTKNSTLGTSYRARTAAGRPTPHTSSEGI